MYVSVLSLVLTNCLIVADTQRSPADDQNICVLKHMLTSYTGNDIMSFSNMANLFDAITLGYHKKADSGHLTEEAEVYFLYKYSSPHS